MLKTMPYRETHIAVEDNLHRAIVYRTRGRSHGPITRLMSPSDLGEELKPFVFLDLIDAKDLSRNAAPRMGLHPHSGIATLTWLFEGAVDYEDDLGRKGSIEHGWMEWMQAGSGAWHGGGFGDADRLRGFQLWVALPPAKELGQPFSAYVGPASLNSEGPVTVLLGSYGRAKAVIEAPSPINYFAVRLRAGETWRYQPPAGHEVAWAAVSSGQLWVPNAIDAGEMVSFEEGEKAIEFLAVRDTEFVFGSAARHPHELALGYYSVHTSAEALARGEARIAELGRELQRQGRLK
ncbi:pirin family protein [Dyella sp. LX-66]|uniref:pirin family protein n=1 Tax=unclassified Dyella TaxID=2634549 RepID=UPI001BDFA2FF|nr:MULTISPECIES: pirin family protein [unclassified Dyella]MBT2119127.1 pirin family protein [Dyella sp. LX-1]MBT2141498.1 pirin family protein [Dyella sp. LX-66]